MLENGHHEMEKEREEDQRKHKMIIEFKNIGNTWGCWMIWRSQIKKNRGDWRSLVTANRLENFNIVFEADYSYHTAITLMIHVNIYELRDVLH